MPPFVRVNEFRRVIRDLPKSVVVELEGVEEFRRALRELPRAVARKVVRQATREAARPILAQAKADVPVADEDGGSLKRSLKIRAIRRTRKLIGVTVRTASPEELGNKTARYGAAQEYGAPRRNMSAQPYLTTALLEESSKGLAILRRMIGTGIEREAARLANR